MTTTAIHRVPIEQNNDTDLSQGQKCFGKIALAIVAVLSIAVGLRLGFKPTDWFSFLQTWGLAATLFLLWRYTIATYELARSARAQVEILSHQFRNSAIQELKQAKPIVFTDRTNGGYHVRNVGQSFAVNVWYLVEGQAPVSLGSLGENQSLPLPFEPADRHLLIAEARPGSRRKWTPTLNARSGEAFWHGFIRLEAAALESEESLSEFLTRVPDIYARVHEGGSQP